MSGQSPAPAAPPTAPITARLAVLIYELVLVVAVLAVTYLMPHMFLAMATHLVAGPVVQWAHLVLVLCVYFCWFWTHGGQTLAMKTWRVRLVTQAGGPVPLHQALIRFGLAWLGLCLGAVGYLWIFFDPDRQLLQDRLAGTRLVRTPR